MMAGPLPMSSSLQRVIGSPPPTMGARRALINLNVADQHERRHLAFFLATVAFFAFVTTRGPCARQGGFPG